MIHPIQTINLIPLRAKCKAASRWILLLMICASSAFAAKKNNSDNNSFCPLNESNGPKTVAREWADIEDDGELAREITLLGKQINDAKCYDRASELIDQLLRQHDTRMTVAAGSLLLAIVQQVSLDSHSPSDDIINFPDSLCEQAAHLLDDNNPIVQALGEWAIALRVKQQGSAGEMAYYFPLMPDPPAWYIKWHDRGPEFNLQDDYARQLIMMNRHYSSAGVLEAVERIATQVEKMYADPVCSPAKMEKLAFDRALSKARSTAGRSKPNLERSHTAYLDLRQATRDLIMASRPDFPSEGFVFFTNPKIPGGNWNVNVPVTGNTNPPLGDGYRKRGADPALAPEPLIKGRLGGGSIRGMDLVWEGDKLVFSFWHQPLNLQTRGYELLNAHLYEMDLATEEITALTDEPGYNDIEPCFLPDGGYVFSSDRASFGNQCAGPILQNKRCTTLFRLDPKRADKPVAISNNKDFDRHAQVLDNGNIVFMHWEYQERGLYSSHQVWRCRPDGSNMDAYYKQHMSEPYSIRGVRQIPGSELHVATAQGHHSPEIGPLILINPSLGINNEAAMWLVSPGTDDIEGGLGPLKKQVVPEGGTENNGGAYINPFPMSEKAFLVGNDLTKTERTSAKSEFSIYYVDVWGNRELLHKDKDMSCFMPMALRPRKRPPIVADIVDTNATFATAFVENVYNDLPGVPKGSVKYLRISQSLMLPAPVYQEGIEWEYNHLHFLPGDATTRHFSYWVWSPSRTIGIVRVEDDGSAYFKVPAGTPVYLQALDSTFCEIRRMRTSFTLQRGEFRSCTGCHESRLQTVGTRTSYPADTLSQGPQTPIPPPWGETTVLDYQKDIQPIFNKHCISCHGEYKPAGGIDLTDRKIGGFNQSYRSLFGLKPSDPTPIRELDWHFVLEPEATNDSYIVDRDADSIFKNMQVNLWPNQLVSISDRMDDSRITQPYQFGSTQSRLIQVFFRDKQHNKLMSSLSTDEWLALVTWVDYNATYHSTLFDVRHYAETKTFTRVPYNLPSVWQPADLNPSFLNECSSISAK